MQLGFRRMPSGGGAGERYHHGDLRRALIETAIGTLMGDGTTSLSLRDLARRVGVSPAAPYRHFPNVTALLRAVAAEGFWHLSRTLTAVNGATPAEQMIRLGHAYVGFAQRNRALYRLMFGPDIDRRADLDLAEAMDAAFAPLAAAVSALEPEDAVFGALSGWSMLHGLARLVIDGQVAGLGENARHKLITNAMATMVAGLRPRRLW